MSGALLDCHYAPGVAYPPTMNHVRNTTATMNTITGKAIPILIKTPVNPCFLYVWGLYQPKLCLNSDAYDPAITVDGH